MIPGLDILADCVRHHLDLDAPITLERIATGKFNTSWFVHIGDDRECVLRIAPPDDNVFLFYERQMMRQEPRIHQLLLENTDVPVAPVIAFDHSRTLIDRNFILMERLRGEPISDAVHVDDAAVSFRLGQCLAQVHSQTTDRYGYIGEHRPMRPETDWTSAFRVMWGRLLDDIVGVGCYTDLQRDVLLQLLEQHIDCFDREEPASLLHMDVWAQNILVDNGQLSGLVDWDRALWGDPEIEFAVLEYCGVLNDAFYEGYGVRMETTEAAMVRRVFYLLYEHQKYIVIRAGRGNEPAVAESYRDDCLNMVRKTFGDVI